MPRAKVRIPGDEEMRRITRRAVAEIIPEAEFIAALRSGRPLRLKMGFDPTRPVITLGWAVGLRKLRQLQELGHQVVIVIGDWTARIGDPSGESQTRPMLSADEVKANAQAVLRQFYRVLDEERTEVRWQSEWFDPFTLADVVRLAARFTVAQMLQRDDFAQRFRARKPIGIHELIYPLLQAYDSIAIEADVEFGGSDQRFNILVGRELQAMLGQFGPSGRPQSVFLVPLLVGLDGRQKMSQSLGNYIANDAPPHDMYGKIMSIPDSLMPDYYELLTDVPEESIEFVRDAVLGRTGHPGVHAYESKKQLAREIVAQFHSPEDARKAEEEFEGVFVGGGVPENVVEFKISFSEYPHVYVGLYDLPHIMAAAGVVSSVSEARRLIRQGAIEKVSADGSERIHRFVVPLSNGDLFRIGKHRFLRIVDADRRSRPDSEPRREP